MRRTLAAVLPLTSTLLTLGALELGARTWADPTGGHAAQADGMYAQVRDAAVRRGFHALDLRDAYRGHPASELRFLQDDPIHPSALGHRLAADAIAAALVAAHLVPRAPACATP